ncbi:struthiocalcin-1-like [Paroedura picta]|uniref:struthiocalcin-1-like n=1 Tax=Paroedura picta TaxID=143630 RepID=UPI004056B061
MAMTACFSLGLLVCLAIGPFMSGGQAAQCPGGWLSSKGNCYGYFSQEMTWRQAQAHCQRQGASLASILDAQTHADIADFLRRTQWDDEDVWIGLHIPTRSQRWAWADGSQVGYTAWARFKPSPYMKREHCTKLDEDSGFMVWDNDSCNDRNPFLCKL